MLPGGFSSRWRSCFAFSMAKGCGAPPNALRPSRDAAEDGGNPGAPASPGWGNMGSGGWPAAAAAAAAGPSC